MSDQEQAVNRAFSRQATHFDEDDSGNPILTEWRTQVYDHVNRFLSAGQSILELNAGTGIDAIHFARQGHRVHATDLSDGMIAQLKNKITHSGLQPFLSFQQLSYQDLSRIEGQKFDYVFSNFGGLNCTSDLTVITRQLPALLNDKSHVTWVIMPKVCPWEIAGLAKGHGRKALRRFSNNGALSHLEGEYFRTYYFSLRQIRQAFGKSFRLVGCEGLGSVSPPPSRPDFPARHPAMYSCLQSFEKNIRSTFPFNRWADHLIVTFQHVR